LEIFYKWGNISRMIDIQVRDTGHLILFLATSISVASLASLVATEIIHLDYGLKQIWEELGQPDLFLLDTAPIHRMIIVCSPTIAEQITKVSSQYPYSVPKTWTVKDILPLVGKKSILNSEVSSGILLHGLG